MFELHISNRTEKFLEKLNTHIKNRLVRKLKELVRNPVPQSAKFIERQKGEKVFRYRIGSYRALYKIKGNIILITKMDKRPRVYDR